MNTHALSSRWLRRHAFRPPVRFRIGAEAELLVHDATTGRPATLDATLAFLRRFAGGYGWMVETGDKGAPRFRSAEGGSLTLEPGGQLEYATPPHALPRTLHDDLHAVLTRLEGVADGHGLRLVAAGIDPVNGIEAAPLLLDSPRYRAMDAYFAAIGPAGARMMRQTAALQINVDAIDPREAWRTLNAVAPVLVAAFARSSAYAGAPTGHASFRASTWRAVDPARTGILGEGPPEDVYAAFALGAPVMLGAGKVRSAAELLAQPGRAAAWATHLSTLFPEVRPRGHLEVRSIDAQPATHLAAPLLMVSVLAWDPSAAREAATLVGPPDSRLLELAGRCGVRDARLAQLTDELSALVLQTARTMRGGMFGDLVDRAQDELGSVRRERASEMRLVPQPLVD